MPPLLYKTYSLIFFICAIFFPEIHLKEKKRNLPDKDKQNNFENKRKKTYGCIINKTGKRITFPKNMEKKYCAEFLDTNEYCKYGDNCSFAHASFPGGFTECDRALMAKHVDETEGLSFKNKNVS